MAHSAIPRARDQRLIIFIHSAVTQQLVQFKQSGARFGQQQTAGGIAVKAVGQLQVWRVRPQPAQRLDQAHAYPAAAMHGQPGRLIQHQKLFVLVQNAVMQPVEAPGFDGRTELRRGAGTEAHWRNTHHITGLEAVVRVAAAFVQPYLALAYQAVNAGARHALEEAKQEIVEALTGVGVINRDMPNSRAGGIWAWGRGICHVHRRNHNRLQGLGLTVIVKSSAALISKLR